MLYYVIFIVILILILLIIYVYNKSCTTYENYDNIKVDIGNVLSLYYYTLVRSILKKEDFNFSHNDAFMSEFPKFIKYSMIEIRHFIGNYLKNTFNSF